MGVKSAVAVGWIIGLKPLLGDPAASLVPGPRGRAAVPLPASTDTSGEDVVVVEDAMSPVTDISARAIEVAATAAVAGEGTSKEVSELSGCAVKGSNNSVLDAGAGVVRGCFLLDPNGEEIKSTLEVSELDDTELLHVSSTLIEIAPMISEFAGTGLASSL